MKNTITIGGVTIEPTKEQVEKLKVELGVKKKSPFERVKRNAYFHSIALSGRVTTYKDLNDRLSEKWLNSANYCTDKDLMTKRAKEEVLNRLLWRFSMENDGDKIDWNDGEQVKYCIQYDYRCKAYSIRELLFSQILTVYFHTEEIAQRAIDEIIIPFNEGKLPCCEIWKE